MNEFYFTKKLSEYFSATPNLNKLGILPAGVTSFTISDARRLSARAVGNDVYSFLLKYQDGNLQQLRQLIFKAYGRSLDPILRRYSANENLERGLKEFQVLTSLNRVCYPVPRAFFYESGLNFFGSPFIILEKVELTRDFSSSMDQFTRNLVWLHKLDKNTLSINTIKSPEGPLGFAKQCLLYLKTFLYFYPSHKTDLKKNFELSIRWLESNISSNSCTKYCLLHGDYRARINTVMTKNSRMIVMDWEDAEIGDPAYDVAMAYTRARVDFGEKIADDFVYEYLRHFDENLANRLYFYKLVAQLRLAISHSSVLSNPFRAYEIRGLKAFISFPFLSFPFVSKMTGIDLDITWIKSFEDFVKENLR